MHQKVPLAHKIGAVILLVIKSDLRVSFWSAAFVELSKSLSDADLKKQQ